MLGQQAEERVEDLTTQMMGPDRPSESPLDKAGRLTQARMAASEEIVRVDLEPPEFLREEPDETPTTPAGVAEDRLDQETSALRELQMTGSTRYFLLPWFTARPELVLGRQHVAIGLYGAPGLQVTAPDPADTARRLSAALTDQAHTARSLGLGWQPPSPDQTRNMPAGRLATSSKHPAGHIRPAAGGRFEQLTEGVWTPVKLARSHHDEFRDDKSLDQQVHGHLTRPKVGW